MVPLDARGVLDRIASALEEMPLLARGAEADVRLGEIAGLKAVFKHRRGKPYMHPRLDASLRFRRTRREARVVARLREAGVPAPALYAVFPSIGLLVLEYIEGEKLKEVFDRDPRLGVRLSREAGRLLAMIHKAGVVHGDYTTSNLIVRGGVVHVIDFGLSDFSTDIEERATDVHLFRRSLESAHAPHAAIAFREFADGYLDEAGPWGGDVLRRADEIRLRGRYVEARRRSVWASLRGEGGG